MSAPPPDLHTPSGCRSHARSIHDEPPGPAWWRALFEADWEAEAWLIERGSDSDVRYPETDTDKP